MLYDDLVQPGEYICHHGVKGQKWGVRHDREKTGRKISLAQKMANKLSDKIVNSAKTTEQREALLKKFDMLDENAYWDEYRKNPKGFKWTGRLKAAADTGLKAAAKCGWDAFDSKKGITDDDRFWFVCEDQTIGLATIADLVNRNVPKNQIFKLIEYSADITDNTNSEIPGVFQLANNYTKPSYSHHEQNMRTLNQFIDECERYITPVLSYDNNYQQHQQAMNMHIQATNQFNNVNNIMNTHHMMGHF